MRDADCLPTADSPETRGDKKLSDYTVDASAVMTRHNKTYAGHIVAAQAVHVQPVRNIKQSGHPLATMSVTKSAASLQKAYLQVRLLLLGH